MIKRLLLVALLAVGMTGMLGTQGCSAKKQVQANVQPAHPNQLSDFDSEAYDTLNVVQAGLDQTKAEYAKAPASVKAQLKEPLNAAIAAYNLAEAAWQGYHANGTGELDLRERLRDAQHAVSTLRSAIPRWSASGRKP